MMGKEFLQGYFQGLMEWEDRTFLTEMSRNIKNLKDEEIGEIFRKAVTNRKAVTKRRKRQ